MSTDPKPVAAVSVKLPEYWPLDPDIWFMQVEAQFSTKGITAELTKYNYIVAALQPEIAQEVRDILSSIPSSKPYETLKAELIKRTSESQQKRLKKLLQTEELGDRKPTQLLRRMQQLLGTNKLEPSILRQLFLQRLPQNVQFVLASTSTSLSVEELASLADNILDVAKPSFVASLSTPTTSSHGNDREIDDLKSQVAKLTAQLDALTVRQDNVGGRGPSSFRRNGRSTSRNRSGASFNRSRSRSQSASHSGSECWYHWKFGDKAKKCVKPCSFKSKNLQEN